MRLWNKTGALLHANAALKPNYAVLVLLVLITFVSVGCGKKGPLYIPAKDAEIINKPPAEITQQPAAKEAVKDVVAPAAVDPK